MVDPGAGIGGEDAEGDERGLSTVDPAGERPDVVAVDDEWQQAGGQAAVGVDVQAELRIEGFDDAAGAVAVAEGVPDVGDGGQWRVQTPAGEEFGGGTG